MAEFGQNWKLSLFQPIFDRFRHGFGIKMEKNFKNFFEKFCENFFQKSKQTCFWAILGHFLAVLGGILV